MTKTVTIHFKDAAHTPITLRGVEQFTYNEHNYSWEAVGGEASAYITPHEVLHIVIQNEEVVNAD